MSDQIEDPGLNGKVVWPIGEGQIVEYEDAYATLFDISDAAIELSYYHQNGNDLTGNLELQLCGWQSYEGAPGTYFAKPLKLALEEVLEKLVDDDNSDEDIAKLEKYGDDENEREEWKDIAGRTLRDRPNIRKSRRLAELLLEAYAAWEAGA